MLKVLQGAPLIGVILAVGSATPASAAQLLPDCDQLHREMRWHCAYTSDGDTWECKKAEFKYWFWC